MRDARGGGSLRQRRPGVWEVRVAVGQDPDSGRSRYLSFSVHGDRDEAQAAGQQRLVLRATTAGRHRRSIGARAATLDPLDPGFGEDSLTRIRIGGGQRCLARRSPVAVVRSDD